MQTFQNHFSNLNGFPPINLFTFQWKVNNGLGLTKLVSMNTSQHPFVFRHAKQKKDDNFEYLGADGLPTEKTYASYLESSEEFRAKARKYAKDNLHLKNSTLLYVKVGYDSSDQLEQEILLKREEQLMQYNKMFSHIPDDLDALAENFKGKSKKVRVIRDLQETRKESFSDKFDEKGSIWFTRYCILSRFIQAVRKIIFLKRLEKALIALRTFKAEQFTQIPRGSSSGFQTQ